MVGQDPGWDLCWQTGLGTCSPAGSLSGFYRQTHGGPGQLWPAQPELPLGSRRQTEVHKQGWVWAGAGQCHSLVGLTEHADPGLEGSATRLQQEL